MYIFYPNSFFKDFIWNFLSLILFVWTAFWAPFNMAFLDKSEKPGFMVFLADVVLYIIYIDIIFMFFTSYLN